VPRRMESDSDGWHGCSALSRPLSEAAKIGEICEATTKEQQVGAQEE